MILTAEKLIEIRIITLTQTLHNFIIMKIFFIIDGNLKFLFS